MGKSVFFTNAVKVQMLTEDPSTTTSLPREGPPLAFNVEYRWKEGGRSFDRLAFYNTIVENVAVLTAKPWNRDFYAIQFSPTYNIRIGFVSDRSGPGLQAKHVVWAHEELFKILVEHDRYSIGNIVVNSDWDTGRLAVGTITTPGSGSVLANPRNVHTGSLTTSNPENPIMNTPMSDINDTPPSPSLRLVNSTQSEMRTIQLPVSNQTSDSVSSHLNDQDRIQLHITYTPDGATFHDVQIYNASLKLLVRIAQVADQQGTIWPMISTYNDMNDFTLSVGPVSFAKRSELSWGDTGTVLAYMGVAMSTQGTPGRMWAELEGIIETDKIFTGVFCIAKGDRTGWRPADACPRPSLDGVHHDDTAATA